jgi:hypothetical protein
MCGNAPSAPNLPSYPGMSSGQQQIVGQQAGINQQYGNIVGGVSQQLGANQNILQQLSGLFNSDGTVNQNAVAQLQQLAGGQTGAAGTAGTSALSGLGSTQQALGATSQAYQNALQGNVPQNQQLSYQQNQNFLATQEQAAQQGIKITGTNWNDAVSDSTAGQKLIQNLQQNNNIQNQQYALGYTGQLAGNMGQLSGAYGTQANSGMGLSQYSQQTPLNYLGQSITQGQSALSPLLQQYGSSLTSAYNPLYTQQNNQYMAQMGQAQGQYQGDMNQYNAQNQQLYGGIGLGMQAAGTGMGIASMLGAF